MHFICASNLVQPKFFVKLDFEILIAVDQKGGTHD